MAVRMIALKCPSCGNSSKMDVNEARYGLSITCPCCDTISVLTINRQLHIRRLGDRICISCGMVSSRRSRFCQCGASIVRTCRACQKEVAIDLDVCDHCGYNRNVAAAIKQVEEALRATDLEVQLSADDGLMRILRHEGEAGKALVPALVALLDGSQSEKTLHMCCYALNHLKERTPVASKRLRLIGKSKPVGEDTYGLVFRLVTCAEPAAIVATALEMLHWPAVKRAIPVKGYFGLDEGMSERNWQNFACKLLEDNGAYAASAAGEVVRLMEVDARKGRLSTEADAAIIAIGRPAIPFLERFTGWFAPQPLKRHAQELINRIKSA